MSRPANEHARVAASYVSVSRLIRLTRKCKTTGLEPVTRRFQERERERERKRRGGISRATDVANEDDKNNATDRRAINRCRTVGSAGLSLGSGKRRRINRKLVEKRRGRYEKGVVRTTYARIRVQRGHAANEEGRKRYTDIKNDRYDK
ncbi:unnamed protein product [Xylocopa violacea]|uniref:Uncharacterized protein n=1 Tax=Xylocopa violacea TaxID=135666 RepID=A0ABP1NCD9_XYLVO